MGKAKKNTKKRLLKKAEIKSPIKTRSTAKLIHSLKQKEIVSVPARATRLREKKSNINIQQITPAVESTKRPVNRVGLDKVKSKEIVPVPVRITRSKTEKPKDSVEKKTPTVVPTKQLVKRVAFVKAKTFNQNDIILAKQKYSTPWPAIVLNIQKERVFVYFFGDKRSGYVSSSEIYDYAESIRALKSYLVLTKKIPSGFITGVREVEALLKIPQENSVLNVV